jgi:hypothetical protein
MVKLGHTTLVNYEFDAYIYGLDSASKCKIHNILLTEDEINWVKVEKINVINIEEIGNNSVDKAKKRICGIFETKPVYWTYAKIIFNDNTNTKCCDAIVKMPKSPVMPVVFNVKVLRNVGSD